MPVPVITVLPIALARKIALAFNAVKAAAIVGAFLQKAVLSGSVDHFVGVD